MTNQKTFNQDKFNKALDILIFKEKDEFFQLIRDLNNDKLSFQDYYQKLGDLIFGLSDIAVSWVTTFDTEAIQALDYQSQFSHEIIFLYKGIKDTEKLDNKVFFPNEICKFVRMQHQIILDYDDSDIDN